MLIRKFNLRKANFQQLPEVAKSKILSWETKKDPNSVFTATPYRVGSHYVTLYAAYDKTPTETDAKTLQELQLDVFDFEGNHLWHKSLSKQDLENAPVLLKYSDIGRTKHMLQDCPFKL